MEPVQFAIVGSGWRSEFFIKVSRELPERFTVSGVLARDAEKGAWLEQKWGVPTYRTLDELLAKTRPLFIVLSVSKSAAPGLILELTERGFPVLTETPPAPDLKSLNELYQVSLKVKGAKIQVAEQYAFQPMHAARLALSQSGKLGLVSQAQISVTQEYHAISLMRRLMGLGFENASITARRFTSPIVAGPNRKGPPPEEKIITVSQTIALLDFDSKLGVYDFATDQHRSWVRSYRVLVRGERGEISNNQVRYLRDYLTPITLELVRQDAGLDGNMEGYYHKGILAGDEWIYQNPFIPASLSDDEIAVATCLAKMTEYAQGGPSFYSLAEASQDHYLGLMIEEAVNSGDMIRTTSQSWANSTHN